MLRSSILLLAFFLISTTPASADEEPRPQTEATDEVVREVVRLLQADVGEEVIFKWLQSEAGTPGQLSADDIIALTRAGASHELIGILMGFPRQTPPQHRPPTAAQAPLSSPKEPPPSSAEPGSASDGIPVVFAIRYRPLRDAEAEEDQQWHLFAYLDGHPLAWSDGKNWISRSRRVVEVTSFLRPGTHTVRLVQERHDRRGKAWFHEARACPDPIQFEAIPGRRVEIEVREPAGLALKAKRAYRWALSDDGTTHSEKALSAPFESWPPVCEEIEINYVGKKKVPRYARKQLERCMPWADLWPGISDAPPRSAVREALQSQDFRPTAASD